MSASVERVDFEVKLLIELGAIAERYPFQAIMILQQIHLKLTSI